MSSTAFSLVGTDIYIHDEPIIHYTPKSDDPFL